MKKEFVPYELAVKLKDLGFDEPCFGYYDGNHNFNYMFEGKPENFSYRKFPLGHSVGWTSAPTFSQAFRWFREKDNAVCEIIRKEDGNHSEFIGWVFINNRKIDVVSYWDSKTYEEAELACLDKLIEIVESENK